MDQSFLIGINYWPRMKAMYMWSDFDAGEIQEEFALIRELGFTVVRIFLLWDDFQPAPGEISSGRVNELVKVCDIAESYNLKLDITFFTGHMSGPSWAPDWMLSGEKPKSVRQVVSGGNIVNSGYLNPYAHPLVIEAEKLLLRTIVGALKDHPAVWCWNLGNEPDLFAFPPSDIEGAQWVSEMAKTIRSIDPVHPVTCGLHVASLLYNNGLRVDQVFSNLNFTVMHAYPMYMEGMVKDPLDPDFVPFTCALTSALSGKQVLMEEFGGCTAAPGKLSYKWEFSSYGNAIEQFMASEESLAAYYSQVLPRLVQVGSLGAFVWCFADYHPSLWERPPLVESPHERFFGLVRPDGSLKPHAKVLSEFAATKPVVLASHREIKLAYPVGEYYDNTLEKLLDLYADWNSKSQDSIPTRTRGD